MKYPKIFEIWECTILNKTNFVDVEREELKTNEWMNETWELNKKIIEVCETVKETIWEWGEFISLKIHDFFEEINKINHLRKDLRLGRLEKMPWGSSVIRFEHTCSWNYEWMEMRWIDWKIFKASESFKWKRREGWNGILIHC